MDTQGYREIRTELDVAGVRLLAVSKTKSVEDILALYALGQRDFGENYVQELLAKQPLLPADIRWHFIGHLQSNKTKYLTPFVRLIQGVDSEKLLLEIDKQSARQGRVTDCLLQVFIAREETKFGFDPDELRALTGKWAAARAENRFTHIRLAGLMGMASQSPDEAVIRQEFRQLKTLFDEQCRVLPGEPFDTLSMGMSGDYRMAVAEGSTMVRIGTRLFGAR